MIVPVRFRAPRLAPSLTAALLALSLGGTLVYAASFRAATTDAGNSFSVAVLSAPTGVTTAHSGGLSPVTVRFTPPAGSIASAYQVQRAGATAGPYTLLSTLPVQASSSAADIATPTTGSQPNGVTAGPDGNVWFTEKAAGKVARVTSGGTVTEFTLTTGASPAGITTGPDGRMWFAESGLNKLGAINTAGTGYVEYAAGSASGPQGIAAGPDGRIWFTEMASNKIATMKTDGTNLLETSSLGTGAAPYGITAGPDGNLWFTESGAASIGRIPSTLATGTGAAASAQPIAVSSSRTYGITTGPDGNIWFADRGNNKVGRIAPYSGGTAGTVSEFGTGLSSSAGLQDVAAGPDGNLWVTENANSKIAKVTPAGVITESATVAVSSNPTGVAAGPDGNIWYGESAPGRIAHTGTNSGGQQSYVDTSAPYGNVQAYYRVVSVLSSWTAASASTPALTWLIDGAGTDTTTTAYTLTAGDLVNLVAPDNLVYTSQHSWPNTNIDPAKYLEMDAAGIPTVSGGAPKVVLTLGYAITSAGTATVQVQVWDGTAWQVASGFAAPTATFSTQSVDISSIVTSWAKVQTLKVRFFAAKTGGAAFSSQHDVAAVSVN